MWDVCIRKKMEPSIFISFEGFYLSVALVGTKVFPSLEMVL